MRELDRKLDSILQKIDKVNAGPAKTIGGVASDGGGYIIVNGRLIRIPPWNPELYGAISIFQSAAVIKDDTMREKIQESALSVAEKALSQIE
ncbi:Hypothetical protein Tpal_237 [Trichococcus palustris]|uniref:Uncharacterized protein n=1 Tax=Trichococcus palustris TaxID=140314 RepID=A0A143Y7Y6_9LACT|nr:hypothetical protein [Trichococcus palustris]CZQ81749.1 Hypothetical protein Tpal_237 [Trichococcus palustris]SFK61853.1 hypothetical protein SAMN04488076_10253 [Trichococcus palustris]